MGASEAQWQAPPKIHRLVFQCLFRQALSFPKVGFFFLDACFLFITEVRHSGSQTSSPSAPSGADMSACVPLSLSLQCVMNWAVSCLIGNNNRNYKLRILPDRRISLWNIIYTVWECVISFVFQRWLFTQLYIQCFCINGHIWMRKCVVLFFLFFMSLLAPVSYVVINNNLTADD